MDTLSATRTAELFTDFFDSPSHGVVSAPGRVNLIGEHTDYNQGFVLPVAINYHTYIAYAPRSDRQLRAVAWNLDNEEAFIPLTESHVSSPQLWTNYVRGVVQQLVRAGFHLSGGDLYLAGDLPAGAGLSSSASLEMAVIRALLALSGESIDPTQAALLGQAAENQFVGCNCGIMDQLISAQGKANHALLIDCDTLTTRAVPMPTAWEMLIVHSGVKRGLVDSEYNTRRAQCEVVAAQLGKTSLRELSLETLMAQQSTLDPVALRRARHVLTENARTLATAEALASGDFERVKHAMRASHISMRDDFEITTPEIDTLVEILQHAGAGARMTGGGFGGCVIAIAPREQIHALIDAVETRYHTATGCTPSLYRAVASQGAFSS